MKWARNSCPLNARKITDNLFCNIQTTWNCCPVFLRFKLVNCLVIPSSSSFDQFVLSESLNMVRFHRWKLQIIRIVGSFRFSNVFLKMFFWSLHDLLLSITGFVQCTSVTGVEFGLVREKAEWIMYKSEAKWINKFMVLTNTRILSNVLKIQYE